MHGGTWGGGGGGGREKRGVRHTVTKCERDRDSPLALMVAFFLQGLISKEAGKEAAETVARLTSEEEPAPKTVGRKKKKKAPAEQPTPSPLPPPPPPPTPTPTPPPVPVAPAPVRPQ